MPSSLNEASLEAQIVADLAGQPVESVGIRPRRLGEAPDPYGGAGYIQGNPGDYDAEFALDLHQLHAFLTATQPEIAAALSLENDTPARRQFLARLRDEIGRRGVIDVLRKGIHHRQYRIQLYYSTPSPGNVAAAARYAQNIFSVTRQVHYSQQADRRSLDLVVFINGLPIATFELKNRITKQTVQDAINQYKRDRDPRELLFQFGRCVVHFAVDDQEVWMSTHLRGKDSWFLPFNKGYNAGAGNPPNPNGLKTDYLWKEVLQRDSLADILENYAQIVEEKAKKGRRKVRKQIFPRYHQLDAVRKLLSDAAARGVGQRYLIQHSAGSGKSNSIAWLVYQLIGLEQDGQAIFDSIIVVTDRRVLDRQIYTTIKQFTQVSAMLGHADRSSDLREFIEKGKKVIITTVQKFPFILDEIGAQRKGRRFAIIIDEAHSSQGGRTTAQMHMALAKGEQTEPEEELDFEDLINRIIEARKMLPNASYFAFTATPKNRTLQLFGVPVPRPDGTTSYRPFHVYSMKQAIQEGFIRDVLENYTPVATYFRLIKTVEDDPEFDRKKAQGKLRRFVHGHRYAIEQKARIMIDHFHDHVIARNKINGRARAMVVTSSVRQAIDYFLAFQRYLQERNSPWKAIVAFSGEREYGGRIVSEASLNGFPSRQIPEMLRQDPYRFLIVAEKFQTGFDEPLLHTMYVDKVLAGIQAVQTLSRLNRAHPHKHDTFVLDFVNDPEAIRAAFEPYYRTTILSQETDPNKLHDLKRALDDYQVYSPEQVRTFVEKYLANAPRTQLDPILDSCVERYVNDLDEDSQVDFKGKAKAFGRVYNFLSSVLPYSSPEWEMLNVFLAFLVPKLPAPQESDNVRGLTEAVDMDTYRAEVQASVRIALQDADGVVGPVPTEGVGGKPESELERLSQILAEFNEFWGNIPWEDKDKIVQLISEEIPAKVAADEAYKNAMRNADRQNARIEHDRALHKALLSLLNDQTELYKLFSDNENFRQWLTDTIFLLTYKGSAAQSNIGQGKIG